MQYRFEYAKDGQIAQPAQPEHNENIIKKKAL